MERNRERESSMESEENTKRGNRLWEKERGGLSVRKIGRMSEKVGGRERENRFGDKDTKKEKVGMYCM